MTREAERAAGILVDKSTGLITEEIVTAPASNCAVFEEDSRWKIRHAPVPSTLGRHAL